MTERRQSRGILAWMLFDWANQPFQTLIVTFIFAPYFVTAVIGDPAEGQALWGTAIAVAGGATALLAPILGAIADRTGSLKPWIAAFSIPYVIGCAGLWLAIPAMPAPFPVLVLFALAFAASELTLILTNALLPQLGEGRTVGRISGSGWALGYVGGLLSLVLVLALIAPEPGSERTLAGLAPIFGLDPAAGEPARATGPLTALWYVVFALPLFLFTPDRPRRGTLAPAISAGLRDLGRTITRARSHRNLFIYLLASMLYRDGLAALFAFGGIFAAGVLGWGLFQLATFGMLAAGAGALGAWVGGRADSAYGPRPVVTTAIWMLVAVCMTVLATSRESFAFLPLPAGSSLPDIIFLAAGAFLGAASGALQAASRSLLIDIARARIDSAQAFGLYALSGRVTAFIGPTLIATITAVTGSQHLGISPVILLFVSGLVLLQFSGGGERQETRKRHR